MKNPKKPGDNISLKTKKNESPLIVDWINNQSNLMDSIRYLIENEVTANGIRNLQNHIPAQRAFPINGEPALPIPKGTIANFHHAEIAATQGQVRKESKYASTDDDIDEEDIESWT